MLRGRRIISKAIGINFFFLGKMIIAERRLKAAPNNIAILFPSRGINMKPAMIVPAIAPNKSKE